MACYLGAWPALQLPCCLAAEGFLPALHLADRTEPHSKEEVGPHQAEAVAQTAAFCHTTLPYGVLCNSTAFHQHYAKCQC